MVFKDVSTEDGLDVAPEGSVSNGDSYEGRNRLTVCLRGNGDSWTLIDLVSEFEKYGGGGK